MASSPLQASVWGYAPLDDAAVITLTVVSANGSTSRPITAARNVWLGQDTWIAKLPPMPAGFDLYTIIARIAAPAPAPTPRATPTPPAVSDCHSWARCRCALTTVLGCYNDSSAGVYGLLPAAQKQLHDSVTLEACAGACARASFSVAGVDGGNHCSCGGKVNVDNATRNGLSRPIAECETAPCHEDPNEKGCGGTNRLLAYGFECSDGPPPPPSPPPPPPPPPPTSLMLTGVMFGDVWTCAGKFAHI